MSVVPVFGRKTAVKVSKILGFNVEFDKGKGGHYKATHSTKIAFYPNERKSNIIIIMGDKEYGKTYRNMWVRELTYFGWSKEELIKLIKKCS